ncbi:MAG: hypothetical protein AAGU21_13360 [Solidesulfovibrio sp.]|uniref:hypothetical protein n=1 Tax=Solidesulfovibrio sp. TaxID=2910990 RepID=UPI002B1FF455|nr:hypothetical protein [Solidesulfovibrio sp.]MEA4857473.1 hypothetical protein [Solidesulfovibrio sp.]
MHSSSLPELLADFGIGRALVLAWLLLVAVAVVLVSRRRQAGKRRRHTARADRDDALRLLRARLEGGAISREEFDKLRRTVDP